MPMVKRHKCASSQNPLQHAVVSVHTSDNSPTGNRRNQDDLKAKSLQTTDMIGATGKELGGLQGRQTAEL